MEEEKDDDDDDDKECIIVYWPPANHERAAVDIVHGLHGSSLEAWDEKLGDLGVSVDATNHEHVTYTSRSSGAWDKVGAAWTLDLAHCCGSYR